MFIGNKALLKTLPIFKKKSTAKPQHQHKVSHRISPSKPPPLDPTSSPLDRFTLAESTTKAEKPLWASCDQKSWSSWFHRCWCYFQKNPFPNFGLKNKHAHNAKKDVNSKNKCHIGKKIDPLTWNRLRMMFESRDSLTGPGAEEIPFRFPFWGAMCLCCLHCSQLAGNSQTRARQKF